ncbi:glucuronate isomerase [Alkalihalobacillus macyae]|uniref:glucuronate isomerase n=1 Tax=Guptibacillus hwajinpoensis TaxID=208199 RepID=UPI00273BB5AF|nr:glucuronate isomerase [Alkalihalobacillus macyae]MDP4551121.1 glucuronate isomerase [Alkalihalobacillus macyae]
MNTFISEDFLLNSSSAKTLYHDYAESLPIIDYHNHLSPKDIFDNRTFANMSEIWLEGDHYKWRAMRACGIDEAYITGGASDKEKFFAWSKVVPQLLGNPLYHWVHMELKRYFDCDLLLNESTAEAIWTLGNEKLESKSVHSLLEESKVEFLGTTDDPTDSLSFHSDLQHQDISCVVAPSFRPDKGLQIDGNHFPSWVEKLAMRSNVSIASYNDFLQALFNRIDVFDELGCVASDHGINEMYFELGTDQEVSTIFEKRLNGMKLSPLEIKQFKTVTLIKLAHQYKMKRWVMQLHIGPLRNNNSKMLNKVGPDSGFDSIGDPPLAEPLSSFLNELEKNDALPKTVLYGLNPRDHYILATMAGNFQGETPGKIQFGTAWWFNDHIDGMENQMKILANVGSLSTFIGMLTDSRSFLSFSRHDYFRRILCNLLGSWSDQGLVPNDTNLLGEYVTKLSYENARKYFELSKEGVR